MVACFISHPEIPPPKACHEVPLQYSMTFVVLLYRCSPSCVLLQVDDVLPNFTSPCTESFALGLVTPMPTLPKLVL